jgi:glutamine phosphoribosylpyrophosphate amidotransferase
MSGSAAGIERFRRSYSLFRRFGELRGMCGIVGIFGAGRSPINRVESLKRLEYRGYDSAGVATLDPAARHRGAIIGSMHESVGSRLRELRY